MFLKNRDLCVDRPATDDASMTEGCRCRPVGGLASIYPIPAPDAGCIEDKTM